MSRLNPWTHPGATPEGGGLRQLGGRLPWRSIGAVAVTVATIAGFLVSGSVAGASPTPPTKYYTESLAPSATLINNPSTVIVNLTNSPSSNQSFGSAEITLPSGVVVGPTIGYPHGWMAQALPTDPSVILLTSVKSASIAPGATLTVTMTITSPKTGNLVIATEVKQSNDFSGTGNDFNETSNSNYTIEVVPSVSITWAQPPSDVQQSIAGKSTFYYMCPPVKVLVSAPDGTPVGGISVSVANGPTGDPGLYYDGAQVAASGESVSSDNNGLAIFGTTDCSSGFAATNLGSGYTLMITNDSSATVSIPTPQSTSFAVAQSFQDCVVGQCISPTITSPANGTSGTIDATFETPGKLLGSFGLGTLTCDYQVTTSAITADPLDSQAFGTASAVVTMTFPKAVVNNLANNGTPLMQVCAGASESFPGATDTCSVSCLSPRYQGLLENCPSYPTNVYDLCVISRSKKAANETITVFIANLNDPYLW
jgi:hypothetical protein